MLESLRARLLLWYSLILCLLIAIYAGTVTYRYSQSLVQNLDSELASVGGTIAAAVTPDADGTFDLNFPPAFRTAAVGDAVEGTYYAVWNLQGQLVDQSDPAQTPRAMPDVGTITRMGRRERVVDAQGHARILVGRPLDTVNAAVRSLGLTVAGTGALVLLLSLVGGSFLAGRALAPVARISQTAGAMIGGDLDARIPVQRTDSELEQVARALNEAFDRMQVASERQRQFTADASHELRTPLATLRAEFDWALNRPRTEADYRGSIEKGRKAVERMSELSDRLLALVRSGTAAAVPRETLDLGEVVAASADLLKPLASDLGVTIHRDFEAIAVSASRSSLADAFNNLLKNAIDYNEPGGSVYVRVRADGDAGVVTIRDTGQGISPEDLPRVFERFFRADRARARASGGSGLGLAIVKKIVDEHGGTVSCASELGAGTTFEVRLPLVS